MMDGRNEGQQVDATIDVRNWTGNVKGASFMVPIDRITDCSARFIENRIASFV